MLYSGFSNKIYISVFATMLLAWPVGIVLDYLVKSSAVFYKKKTILDLLYGSVSRARDGDDLYSNHNS